MRRLVIVRHGNTFRPGETPTRVGRRTDLPLVEEERSRGAAQVLRSHGCIPDRAFAAPLQRTRNTAELILDELGLDLAVHPAAAFAEIDYGPDENRTEDEVRLRLGRWYLERNGLDEEKFSDEQLRERGEEAIQLWNAKAFVPHGWQVDADSLVADWKRFAEGIASGETVMLVSSNGVIRFAPHLLPTEERESFQKRHSLKVTTGGVCVFARKQGDWCCVHWNLKPDLS